jgi:two-component system, probable response regulator PhcQ
MTESRGTAPPTVLVFDPDPTTGAATCAALGEGRYRVIEAADTGEALAALERGEGDLLITELARPDADVLGLLVEAHRRFPLVPRLVITASRDFDALLAAVNEAEIWRCLRKPIDATALRDAVSAALGRAETQHVVRELREAAERRRIALIDLESDFPGISQVARGPEGYFIPRGRLRGLAERLQGTPLAELLTRSIEGAAAPPPLPPSPTRA